MKNKKILISPKNIEEIKKYKKIGITNFLFALQDFSIGYPEFTLEELYELDINVYLNINILFDTKKINDFKKIIPKLQFVKGIFFEDVGLYYLLKDSNIFLIWATAHFVINSISINSWLTRVDSAKISNELTKGEIEIIINKTTKPLVLPVFGYNEAMYSRRMLLTNFNRYKGYKMMKNGLLSTNSNNEFNIIENANGTILFYKKPFNYIKIINNLNQDNILFYYIDASKINNFKLEEMLNYNNSEEKFLNKKTIFKLEER
ncbi:MAG: hypothetical protein PHF21_04110 [Bacilli bacterium]|nr:hypothetical protein [Bacilli bacterium]